MAVKMRCGKGHEVRLPTVVGRFRPIVCWICTFNDKRAVMVRA